MFIPLIHDSGDFPVVASRHRKVVNHSTPGAQTRINKQERRLLLRHDTSILSPYITVRSPTCLKVIWLSCRMKQWVFMTGD